MTKSKFALALLMLVVVGFGLVSWGRWVVRNDMRLLQAYDMQMSQERLDMVARACGKVGKLWIEPSSGRLACLYPGNDFDVVPDGLRAGTRLVRN